MNKCKSRGGGKNQHYVLRCQTDGTVRRGATEYMTPQLLHPDGLHVLPLQLSSSLQRGFYGTAFRTRHRKQF